MRMHMFTCKNCGKGFSSKKKVRTYCSNKCRAAYVHPNFLDENNRPANYDMSKIRFCLTCNKKLHHCTKTGYCRKHYRDSGTWRSNVSKSLKGKTGGIRKGSGRGKCGWYKGFWCDSSWELAWVIYSLDHGVAFERNKAGFLYTYEGKELRYYPDFILSTGEYIEVKGYDSEQFRVKEASFDGKLTVLRKPEMEPILQYVTSKYGKDYISLYE